MQVVGIRTQLNSYSLWERRSIARSCFRSACCAFPPRGLWRGGAPARRRWSSRVFGDIPIVLCGQVQTIVDRTVPPARRRTCPECAPRNPRCMRERSLLRRDVRMLCFRERPWKSLRPVLTKPCNSCALFLSRASPRAVE